MSMPREPRHSRSRTAQKEPGNDLPAQPENHGEPREQVGNTPSDLTESPARGKGPQRPQAESAEGGTSTFTDDFLASFVNLVRPLGRLPWWAQVSLVFLATRLISFAILAAVALQQGLSPWGNAKPSYGDFINIWDAEWYNRIFSEGYPSEIPRNQDGVAQSNQWAFMPLFPGIVRGLAALTGGNWATLAPIVAILFAWAAALMIYQLFRLKTSHRNAMWGMALVFLFPASAVFQVPYAESTNLFFLALALYLVIQKQYLWAIPIVFFSALSRPVGVPFALMLGLYFLYRWIKHKQIPFPVSEVWRLVVLGIASGAAALAWPIIAWMYTGEQSAYTDTETAWRYSELVPFLPWFERGNALFGPLLGAIFPVLLVVFVYFAFTSKPMRAVGIQMQLWCFSYFFYIFAFLNPQTSTFRLLIPLFPIALAVVLMSRSRAYRWSTAIMYVLMQIVWVYWLWRWTQLPGGGDYPP